MRRSSLGLVMVLVLVVSSWAPASEGAAQAEGGAPTGEVAPVLTDPVSGERYVEVRPTDAIERGRWAVPPWLVWCLGGLATVVGGAVLARRMTRARRGS